MNLEKNTGSPCLLIYKQTNCEHSEGFARDNAPTRRRAGSIKNGYAIRGAKVELRAVENNSGTDTSETVTTDKTGQYDFEVSFGYYTLTISARGYQTYRTKVYFPSSVNLEWERFWKRRWQKIVENKFRYLRFGTPLMPNEF